MKRFTTIAWWVIAGCLVIACYGIAWKLLWPTASNFNYPAWQFFDWLMFIPVLVAGHGIFALLVYFAFRETIDRIQGTKKKKEG